jgi:hypothetical protein
MNTLEIVDKVKELVAPLGPAERQSVIRAIEQMEPTLLPQDSIQTRNQMLIEQEKWFAQPLNIREQYRDRYIAVQNGQVVDHDENRIALLLRVRKQHPYGSIPILNGNWDEIPIQEFRSPHQER